MEQATLAQMETCLYPTGDLFYDKHQNKNKELYPDDPIFDSEANTIENVGYSGYNDHRAQIYTYL